MIRPKFGNEENMGHCDDKPTRIHSCAISFPGMIQVRLPSHSEGISLWPETNQIMTISVNDLGLMLTYFIMRLNVLSVVAIIPKAIELLTVWPPNG